MRTHDIIEYPPRGSVPPHPIQRARSTKSSFRYNRTQPATVCYDEEGRENTVAVPERKISARDAEAQRYELVKLPKLGDSHNLLYTKDCL